MNNQYPILNIEYSIFMTGFPDRAWFPSAHLLLRDGGTGQRQTCTRGRALGLGRNDSQVMAITRITGPCFRRCADTYVCLRAVTTWGSFLAGA